MANSGRGPALDAEDWLLDFEPWALDSEPCPPGSQAPAWEPLRKAFRTTIAKGLQVARFAQLGVPFLSSGPFAHLSPKRYNTAITRTGSRRCADQCCRVLHPWPLRSRKVIREGPRLCRGRRRSGGKSFAPCDFRELPARWKPVPPSGRPTGCSVASRRFDCFVQIKERCS